MRLAFDTAFSACSVALAENSGKILAQMHLEQRRGQAESLVPMIEEVFVQAGRTVDAISEIVLITGPGTFAGVRVGVACARTLALANRAMICGLSSLEALAGWAILKEKPLPGTKMLAIVPGKRGEVSFQSFKVKKSGKPPFENESLAQTVSEKDLAIPNSAIITGPVFHSGLEEKFFAHNRIAGWPRAVDLLEIVALFPKIRFKQTVSPFYLRPPDATPQKL